MTKSQEMAKSQADKEHGEAEKKGDKPGGEGKRQQQQTGEPKVKQVKFLDAEAEESEKEPKKEPRRRTKRIMHQLKIQMEFYFGDSNLSKDRFMKQQIDSDPEGYVPISVFMGFGNIQALTVDTEVLVKALKFSSFLQLSEDETKVCRITPVKYMTQEETDARTVYVEGFHKFISREWINTKFSKCGKVTYISMPRFKTSQEIKGYAFVEFETPEEAAKAVQMLNSVPDELDKKAEEKVAASIKQSKNLAYWKKRAAKEGVDPAEVEASLKELVKEGGEEEGPKEGTRSRPKKKKKKNRPGVTQGEGTATDSAAAPKAETTSSVVVTEESKENTIKQEASSEADDTKTKKSKKSKKKRKRKSSLLKTTSEDITSQNISKSEGSVPQSSESELPIRPKAEVSKEAISTAAVDEESVPREDTKQQSVSTIVKEEPEEDRRQSRKRKRPDEAASQEISSKIPKIELGVDSSETGEKKEEERSTEYPCTSLEGSETVWELCEAPAGAGNSESQKTSSGKRKPQTVEDSGEAVQEVKPSDTAKVKDTGPAGDNFTKKSEAPKGKKRKPDFADTPQEKPPRVKKQKEGKFGGQSRRSIDQTAEVAAGEGRKRKRKCLEGGDEVGAAKRRKGNTGSGSEVASEAEDQEGKKKRHRKHKPQVPDIRLRVMTKEMWMHLKKDYLEQQKANMRKLKDQLREASQKRRREQSKNKNNGQDAKEGHPAPQFVANTILEVKSEAELCLQTIKADIPSTVQVAYVDIRPGMTEGYIRCKDAESASKLLKTGLRGLSLSQVEGEAEMQYWNKLITERETKLSDTKRRKRRGKLKILQRAQNPQEETTQRQHLIFADEDMEESVDKSQNPEAMQDDFNAYSCRRRPPPSIGEADSHHHQHKTIGRIYFTNVTLPY